MRDVGEPVGRHFAFVVGDISLNPTRTRKLPCFRAGGPLGHTIYCLSSRSMHDVLDARLVFVAKPPAPVG